MGFELREKELAAGLACLKDLGTRARTNFINGAPNEQIERPVQLLADSLASKSKVAKDVARIFAVMLLKELESQGKVVCHRNGKNAILWIKIVRPENGAFEKKVILRKSAHILPPQNILKAEPEMSTKLKVRLDALAQYDERKKKKTLAKAKRAAQKKALKEIREKERAEKRGLESEERLIKVAAALVWAINNLPELRLSAELDFTGTYDPDTKTGDQKDHAGEDASLYVRSALGKWWIIYNAKSSFVYADAFNKDVYYIRNKYVNQRRADLKKAIVAHPRRPKEEILEEIIEDLVFVGISQIKHFKDLLTAKALSAA